MTSGLLDRFSDDVVGICGDRPIEFNQSVDSQLVVAPDYPQIISAGAVSDVHCVFTGRGGSAGSEVWREQCGGGSKYECPAIDEHGSEHSYARVWQP